MCVRACVCAAGKTELLYHLLCRCVMPTAAGGLEVEVIFVDTDCSLDMLRLVGILDRRLGPGVFQSDQSLSVHLPMSAAPIDRPPDQYKRS